MGGSSYPGGGTSGATTAGATGSTGSSSSLFNSGSSSSTGSSGTSGSSGSSGVTSGSGTKIETAALGQSGAPLTARVDALGRGTSGSNIVMSNTDVIGGQATNGGNQFANLFSQIGRQLNQGGNFNQQGGRNTARPALRIPLRLGFAPKPISTPVFAAKFEERISKLSGLSSVSPIRITMDGSTAVLTGVVATEQDRQLAEGVAMLEPLVENVRNELTVQEQSASDSLSAPTTTP